MLLTLLPRTNYNIRYSLQIYKMAAGHQQQTKSRVAKVDSEETWNTFISRAKEQGGPVVVFFMASWCVPSVAMKSIIKEMSLNHKDILFLLVDVDEVKEVASKMEIKATPTFLLMKEGVLVDKFIGANPDETKKRVELLLINY